eukprot:2691165-Prymnesium_polylepis.1
MEQWFVSMFTTAGPKAWPPPARHLIAGRPSSSIPAWRGRAKRAVDNLPKRCGARVVLNHVSLSAERRCNPCAGRA